MLKCLTGLKRSNDIKVIMIFPDSFIKELESLSEKSYNIQTAKDLTKCVNQLNKIFEYPSFGQIIKELENQRRINSVLLARLRMAVLKDFDVIEKDIRKSEPNNLTAMHCLDISKNKEENQQEEFPSLREAGIRVSLRCLFRDYFQKTILSPLANFGPYIDPRLESIITKMIRTANVMAWENEYKKNKSLSEILRFIYYIKKFKSGISKSDLRKLKFAVQNISSYLLETVRKAIYLNALEVEIINFSFSDNKDPKKAFLIIKINEGQPLRFSGIRSKNIYKLFLNPSKEIDIEDFEFTEKVNVKNDSLKNDYIRKEFDEINRQICKKYYQFGFIYGSNELILSDGYSHRINPKFSHLTKK